MKRSLRLAGKSKVSPLPPLALPARIKRESRHLRGSQRSSLSRRQRAHHGVGEQAPATGEHDAAAHGGGAVDEAVGQGVLIVLDGTIESARDAVKMHTTALDTFQSPEVGALGSVHDGEPVFYRSPLRRHTTRSAFSVEGVPELPRVAVLYAHADDDGFLVEAAVQAGCRGIVYAGMGNGSIPARAEAALARAVAEGVVVVRSTRSAAGRVTRAEASYETNGFIASDTLNPAKARVLLQLTLLQTDDTAAIRKMFKIY